MESSFTYQNSFTYWLVRLGTALQERFNQHLECLGITWSHWLVLSAIEQQGGVMPAQLASDIGVDRSAVTRLVDRLETMGLVQRVREGLDRRSINLYLTEKGNEVTKEANKKADEHQRAFMSQLHATEHRVLKGEVQKMLKASGVDSTERWRHYKKK